jgi:hypothetical protein
MVVLLGVSFTAYADTMQSSNYRIVEDSANSGGLRSSSASYALEDTVGEQAAGREASANYKLKAGYQQMDQVSLSLTGAANVTLSPTLTTTGGGTSTGALALTVKTDDPAGYQLSINAANTPAMNASSANIPNYAPVGGNPDFAFITPSASSVFGFSPEGLDIVGTYRDNGTLCGAGLLDSADRCWSALTTTDTPIATSTSANYPSGTVTTLKFQVGAGASATLAAGSYIATTTVTLIAL